MLTNSRERRREIEREREREREREMGCGPDGPKKEEGGNHASRLVHGSRLEAKITSRSRCGPDGPKKEEGGESCFNARAWQPSSSQASRLQAKLPGTLG